MNCSNFTFKLKSQNCNFYPKSRIIFDKFQEEKLKNIINKKWFDEYIYINENISQFLIINAYRIIL